MRLLALLAALLAAGPALARERAKVETFAPAADASTVDQPNGKPNGRVKAGQSYPLLKRGGPGGAWCKLDLAPEPGWLPCADGGSGGGAAEPKPDAPEPGKPRAGAKCATTCDGPKLFATPPALAAADREVLAACPARPDVAASEADVRRFFAAHYDDPRLQGALSAAGRPGSGAGVKESNVAWLTSLWVGTGPRNAFTHVFCGDDWTGGKLGGLHYLPRFAQLEAEGKLCYRGPAKGQPVVGGQYLIRYDGLAPWSCGKKSLGGFPVDHDPIAMAATATRAFVRCCARDGQKKQGGVYAGPESGGLAWRIWCGERNGTYGIASLYPTDEKPTCRE